MKDHVRIHKAEGVAALSISELLLLALNDLKIISEKDTRDVLMDVATSHTDSSAHLQRPEASGGGGIVERILVDKNGVQASCSAALGRIRPFLP
jgi:hypothetical protein